MHMAKTTLMAIIAAVLIVIGVAIAIAQSSKDNNQPVNNANSNSQNQQQNNTANNSTTNGSVTIRNMMFTPSQATVLKGESVIWSNNDNTEHTVTIDHGNGPDSDAIQPGSTFSYKFNEAGSYQYHCKLHPSMRGTIVVK